MKMPATRETQCYVWDFTIDINDDEHYVPHTEVISLLNAIGKKWAFQAEKGEHNGRIHYQGRISLNEKKRFSELKQEVPERWHLSKTSNDNKGNRFYVQKEETRIDGPWRDAPKHRQEMPKQWLNILEQPRPFQSKILEMMKATNDRKIDLIYDSHGNSGKSSFANRLEFEGRCYQILASKNTNEMCADLCDELEAAMDTKPGMIFVDMERAADQDNMRAIFAAVERIKGGVCKDRRYKLRKVFFQSPPVVMFMNQLPDVTALSKDRWRLWELRDYDITRINRARYGEIRRELAQQQDKNDDDAILDSEAED